MNLRKSINMHIAESGTSKRLFAAKAGLDPTSLSRIMQKNSCSNVTLLSLAKACNQSLSEFIKAGEV